MIDGIILSFELFSRFPFKKEIEFNDKNIKVALLFFPFIGLIIGSIIGAVVSLLAGYSSLVAGAVGLLLYIILTGGMHLDGLSDLSDGFYSNRDRDRILEIMKDSMIGTFGVLSLLIYGILKFTLYSEIFSNNIFYFGCVSYLSRLSTLYFIKRGKIVRKNGFGSVMEDALNGSNLIILDFLPVILMAIYDIKMIIPIIFIFINAEILLFTSNRKIGGVTGDVYGANTEINEIILLLIIWGMLWI